MLFTISTSLTAFIVGFAMKRGGLCTYAAALQIIHQRTTERMLVFLGSAAWAAIVIIPLSWWLSDWVSLSATHHHITTAICGGIILGLGSYLNKGCMFGTFVQLVGGNLAYIATLLGMSIGIIITYQYFDMYLPLTIDETHAARPGAPAYAWLILTVLFVLLMLFQVKSTIVSNGQTTKKISLRRTQTIFIMISIGIGGGLLSATVNGWDYASVLARLTINILNEKPTEPMSLTISCAMAMITGGIYAAVDEGSFKIQSPRIVTFIACLSGGILMGAAVLIIPGGNDGLLLKGIPSFAPHAIVAYTFMVLLMLLLIAAFRSKLLS